MFRRNCFHVYFFYFLLSIANGKIILNNNKPSGIFPSDLVSYIDERIASVTSDITARLEELERRHVEDVHRIDVLERLHASDLHQMMDMGRDIAGLRTENIGLQTTISSLQNQLHSITPMPKNQTSSRAPNTSEIKRNLGSQKGRTSNDIITTTHSITKLRRNLNKDDKWGNSLTRNVPGSTSAIAAFHAILAHTLTDPGNEHAIAFENVVTQVGGLYSKNTGAFTCTQPGVYAFHWSIRIKSTSHYMYTELSRNGDTIGTAISYGATLGSASAVVDLNVGDEVWVRVVKHTSGADIEEYVSMFSGCLIN